MWHKREDDITLVTSFIEDLTKFKNLKQVRWERIDEEVQKAIRPGTPSEDWIIPPDEDLALDLLEKDADYRELREKLMRAQPELKALAKFLNVNAHHDFDWVKFTTPLLGNDAIEDALGMARHLLESCEKKNYLWQNLCQMVQ